jgi:hypothetical protein
VLPLPNVLPCCITLRGCPGLPTVEKAIFSKLYSDISTFVKTSLLLSDFNSERESYSILYPFPTDTPQVR